MRVPLCNLVARKGEGQSYATCDIIIIIIIIIIITNVYYLHIFFHDALAPSGPGYTIKLRHTILSRTPLDEW